MSDTVSLQVRLLEMWHPWASFKIFLILVIGLFLFTVLPQIRWKKLFYKGGIIAALRGIRRHFYGKGGHRRVFGWRMFYRTRVEGMISDHAALQDFTRYFAAKLWVDQEVFRRVKKLLRRARHTVFVQMFIWKNDQIGREIAELLADIADRGVQVTVSKEAIGDVFEMDRDFLGTKKSEDPIWQRFWSNQNIRVLYEAHNDHAKVFIIDDWIFLLTGMNIADEYNDHWHDFLVELRGKQFVDHYLTDGALPGVAGEARLVMNTEQVKAIRPAVTELLQSAKRSIIMEHCYFSDPAVLETLIEKSKQGVRIVVIVSKNKDLHHHANMQSISRLLKEGDTQNLSLFEYPRVFHAKILLVDREKAFIGSANLMSSSLDERGEVNVLIADRDHEAVTKLRSVLREDILMSMPISRPPRLHWLWRWMVWFRL